MLRQSKIKVLVTIFWQIRFSFSLLLRHETEFVRSSVWRKKSSIPSLSVHNWFQTNRPPDSNLILSCSLHYYYVRARLQESSKYNAFYPCYNRVIVKTRRRGLWSKEATKSRFRLIKRIPDMEEMYNRTSRYRIRIFFQLRSWWKPCDGSQALDNAWIRRQV
jgi:hypothetical protein